jgi:hypothetical protein
MTLALIALFTLAPALDFLPKDKIPRAYFEAVSALKAIEVCIGRAPRPTASAGYIFDTEGGDKLVKPVHLRRVPVAAGYGLHFDLAKKLAFPFADGRKLLTPDMICATEHSVQKGADGSLLEHRGRVIGVLREHGELLRPYSLKLNSELMPADVYKISGGMNILMLAALVDAFDMPDKDIARCFWHGFQAIGVVADSFAHRPLQHPTALELARFNKETREIMQGNEDWADEVERIVARRNTATSQSKDTRQRLAAIIETTNKELSRGLISKGLTRGQVISKWGAGGYRPMIRSAVFQGDKWRCIDDGRRSLLNQATLLVETIVTPSYELPLHVARAAAKFARQRGLPLAELHYGLDDLLAAFRTLPTAQQQYNLFATWNPSLRHVEYHYCFGFVFGLKSSVTQFNRFPEVTAAAARHLGVPTAHYFDDFQIIDVASALSTGQDVVYEIHCQVGDGIEAGARRTKISAPAIELAKRKPMAAVNVGLGVSVDLSAAHTQGTVTFEPTANRIRNILAMWAKAKSSDRMTSGDASTLRGKRAFLLECAQGRVGRASSLSLVQREYFDEGETKFTESLQHAYDFDAALLPDLPVRVEQVEKSNILPLLVYTDAMFRPRKRKRRDCDNEEANEWKAKFVSKLGTVLYDPHCDPSSDTYAPELVAGCEEGHLVYASAVPPDEVVATFQKARNGDFQKTYIAQLEILAGVAVYYTHPERVRGRQVNHFIDNTVALSGLVHGYARKLDLARMINAFHLQIAALGANVYYEFVPSKCNVADLPSRDEFELLEEHGGRRTAMLFPPVSDWTGPLDLWFRRLSAPPQ